MTNRTTNLVMVIADSLRPDHLGCYGNRVVKTPGFDEFASSATRFTAAYPESLPTLPVRRAMWTGKRTYPFRNHWTPRGDIVSLPGWSPIPEDQATLAEILSANGYRTAFFTDTMPMFQPCTNYMRGFHQYQWIRGQQQDAWGSTSLVDEDVLRSHFVSDQHYNALGYELRQYLANTSGRSGKEEDYFAPQVYTAAMNWLEENRNTTPFFLLIDTFDPHEPWDPPAKYRAMYADPAYKGPDVIHSLYGSSDYLTPEQLACVRANYAGEVSMVDAWFGHFMRKLEDLGMLESTAALVISDHGHSLGEHNLMGKLEIGMYPELMDIVAMWRDPDGHGAGKVCNELVYNVDFVTTALARLGIDADSDGMDLNPLIQGKTTSSRDYVTSAMVDTAWIRTKEYTCSVDFRGPDAPERQPKLFEQAEDPGYLTNVASRHPEIVRDLYNLAMADAGGEFPIYRDLSLTFADGSARTAD